MLPKSVLVETFVDPRFYQGTAYKVSGWSHLGRTAGWNLFMAIDWLIPHPLIFPKKAPSRVLLLQYNQLTTNMTNTW